MPDTAQRQAAAFGQRLEDLLSGVLGPIVGDNDMGYVRKPEGSYARGGGTSYTISQAEPKGILLYCSGEPVLLLTFVFLCSCRDADAPLQVDKSSVMLSDAITHSPLVRYDFVRRASSEIPSAHINIYGSNDAATRLMLACAGGQRSKSRRKQYVDKGAFPTFSSLHFPVGGDRFRPGLEDLLQMAVYEFHIDAADGWLDVIEVSRETYRAEQVRALAREFPDIVFETLRDMGYVTGDVPQRPERGDVQSRLRKY